MITARNQGTQPSFASRTLSQSTTRVPKEVESLVRLCRSRPETTPCVIVAGHKRPMPQQGGQPKKQKEDNVEEAKRAAEASVSKFQALLAANSGA